MQKTTNRTKITLFIIKIFRIQLITLFLRPLKLNDKARCRKTVVLEAKNKQTPVLTTLHLSTVGSRHKAKNNLYSP
jgi:hypothetical protein